MDNNREAQNANEKRSHQEIAYSREQAVNFAYGFLSTGSIDFFKKFLEKQNLSVQEFILSVGREKIARLVPEQDADWSKWYSFQKLVEQFDEHKNVFIPGINDYIREWIAKAGSSTSKREFFEKMGFTPDQFKEPVLEQIKKDLCSREEKLGTANGIKKEWKISDEDFTELQRESIPFRIQNGHKNLFESLWTSEQMSDPELLDKIVQGGIVALNKYFVTASSYDLADFRATESGALFMKLVDSDKLTQSHREAIQTELRSSLRLLSKGKTIQDFNDLLKGLEEIQSTFKVTISDSEKGCAYQLFSAIKDLPRSGNNEVWLNTETLNLLNCSLGIKDEFKKMLIQNDNASMGFKDFEDLGVARESFLNQLGSGKISIFHINSLIEKYDLVKNAPEELKNYIRTIAPNEIRLYNDTLNEYTLQLIRASGKELFSDEEYQGFEKNIADTYEQLRLKRRESLPKRFLITDKDDEVFHKNGESNVGILLAAVNDAKNFEIDLTTLVTREQLFTKLKQMLKLDNSNRRDFLTSTNTLQELLSTFSTSPREFLDHVGINTFTEALILDDNGSRNYSLEHRLRDIFNATEVYDFPIEELQDVFKKVIVSELGKYSFSITDIENKFKYHAEYLFNKEFKEVFKEEARSRIVQQLFDIKSSLGHAEIHTEVDNWTTALKELWGHYGFDKNDFTIDALGALAIYDGSGSRAIASEITKQFGVSLEMLSDSNIKMQALESIKQMLKNTEHHLPKQIIYALGKHSIELSNQDVTEIFPSVKESVDYIKDTFKNFNEKSLTVDQLIGIESSLFKRDHRSHATKATLSTLSDWSPILSEVPEITTVDELKVLFPEAEEVSRIINEKAPRFAGQLLQSVPWFCNFSQEASLDTILDSLNQNPFLIEALEANPRYGNKLMFKFPYLDTTSQENISKLYSVKANLNNDGLSTTKDSLEYRSATQIQLLDFKENRKIAEKISQHADLSQWLNYDREKYITLGNQDVTSFAEMVKTPVLRINETVSLYRDSIKTVLGEYHQELSQFLVPLESAETIDTEIAQLKERIVLATEKGELAKVAGMTKGQQSLEQKRSNLKTAPLWNKIAGDFDAVVRVGNDVLINHELITAAEQAYNAPTGQVITREERTKQLEFKKQISKFQNDFKDKLNLLERRMNQFTQSIGGLITPCLGKDRSDALIQDLRDRTLEALDHFSSDVSTTQEMISARESNNLSKLDGRPLKIEVWSRDPDVDLYLGNYTDCCIRIDSSHMGEESTIADYLTDLGVQVIKITDEQTNEPVLAAWAYLGELENDKPTFVIDNVEANTMYSAVYHTQLSNLLGEYVKEYADAVGVPADNIIQGDTNNDLVINGTRLGQSDKLGLLYNRTGGYYLEAEKDIQYTGDEEGDDENDHF